MRLEPHRLASGLPDSWLLPQVRSDRQPSYASVRWGSRGGLLCRVPGHRFLGKPQFNFVH